MARRTEKSGSASLLRDGGRDDFYMLTSTGSTYSATVDALTAYFMPKVNVIAKRHAFCKRLQAPNESVLQYVASLHELVATCDFDNE